MLHHLKNKTFSPIELYSASLERIHLIQDLNAFINVTENLSKLQSEESRRRYVENNDRKLEGVPIAIKDNFCTKNVTTTCGSRMLENFIPTYNATVVDRLLNEGAVLMGKTNMDEFGMGSTTTESVFGPTKNIWGTDLCGNKQVVTMLESDKIEQNDFHICGGSSGGSAVAVSSGACFGAIGSDTGGSVRSPASYCGVVGFKPSYGSVSRYGLIPLVNSMDVPGIIAQNIDDCKLLFSVIKGWDCKDPTSIKQNLKKSKLFGRNGINGIRIGIPKEFYCPNLSQEITIAWKEIAKFLESNGAIVTRVSLPHTQYSIACYSVLNACEVASNMARYDGLKYGFRGNGCSVDSLYAVTRSCALNNIVHGRILAGNYFLLRKNYERYFVQAMKLRRLIHEDYTKVWDSGIDALLTPVTFSTAVLYSDYLKFDPRAYSAQQDFFTQPANMAGIPAISMPIKLGKNNLPVSLQLMAPYLDDWTLLDIAKFVEQCVEFPHIQLAVK